MVPCCKVGGSEYSSTLDGLYITIRASLVAELVKNPPAMQETLVQFLGWEDPLENVWTTPSSILGLP